MNKIKYCFASILFLFAAVAMAQETEEKEGGGNEHRDNDFGGDNY